MKVKEESEKVGLKLNIQETKIMASGPITSWQIDGERMETVTDFIFFSSKITGMVNNYKNFRFLILRFLSYNTAYCQMHRQISSSLFVLSCGVQNSGN